MQRRLLYNKYAITKTDGTSVDPDAQYFALRIDTDRHARIALRAYIKSIRKERPKFAEELSQWLGNTPLQTKRSK